MPESSSLLEARDGVAAAAAQVGLRHSLGRLLGDPVTAGLDGSPSAAILEDEERVGYREQLISYQGSTGDVRAYLLTPEGEVIGGVVLHHQHNGEWHLGKSEAVGLCGNDLQAFGPALARRGIAVLAPDAIGFEDRRLHTSGTAPDPADASGHLWEMTSRLVTGHLLMTDILIDAAVALTVLTGSGLVAGRRVGVAGHSFGGHVALFQAALDERVGFACVSGAAGSYKDRLARRVGIGLEQAIPGISRVTDFDGLAALVAPRPLHLISATNDQYAYDADQIEAASRPVYEVLGAGAQLTHFRVAGEHAIDEARAANFVEWVVSR